MNQPVSATVLLREQLELSHKINNLVLKCPEVDVLLQRICTVLFDTNRYVKVWFEKQGDQDLLLSVGQITEVYQSVTPICIAVRKSFNQPISLYLVPVKEGVVHIIEELKNSISDALALHKHLHQLKTTGKKAFDSIVMNDLIESENRYKQLAQLTIEGVIVHKDGKVLDCNDSFFIMTVYSREEVIGKTLFDLFPDKHDQLLAQEKIIQQSCKPYQVKARRKNGSVFTAELEGRNANFNNELIRIAAIRDVSSQNSLHRQIQDYARQLKRSVTNFTHIFNVIQDTICILDMKGRIVEVNQTFIDRMEFSREELINKKVSFIDPTIDDQVILNLINELLIINDLQRFETVHQSKSGRRFSVEVSSKLIIYNGNQSILSISRDITEHKNAEMELNRHQHRHRLEELVHSRTQALEANNKEMEAFTYSVSHDLRAPLRTIHAFAEYLEQDYAQQLDDEGNRYIRVIQDNALKMDSLIVNLLKFSRISRIEPEFIPLNMTALARSMYMEVASEQEQQEFEFIVHPLPTVLGDLTSIKQLWSNLIENALKYSSKSPIKRIIIGCNDSSDKRNTFFVKDFGAGFNMEYKDKLFEVFQRLHKESDYKGTGVGLAIVKRIVEKHKGEVWAESQPGDGAVFYFSLPVI